MELPPETCRDVYRNIIRCTYSNIYIQQHTTLHSLFHPETALHVSGGTTTHYHQERKQLYLQHLVFVTPLLLPAAIVEELDKINCVTMHLVGYILEYSYDARTHER